MHPQKIEFSLKTTDKNKGVKYLSSDGVPLWRVSNEPEILTSVNL